MPYKLNISVFILIGLSALALVGCEKKQAELPCEETVPVTTRHGEDVRETYSGLYIKKDRLIISGCGSRTSSDAPIDQKYITTSKEYYYWINKKAISSKEMIQLNLDGSRFPRILIFLTTTDKTTNREDPSWWYESRIPHQKYPIQLLPNFGLKINPKKQDQRILQNSIVAWAVTGTTSPITGMPFVTSCSIKAPPGSKKDYYEYQRDVSRLTQGEADENMLLGNTCRGSIADESGRIIGMIDVPGAALIDIDSIYKAISVKLTEALVD